MQDISYIYDPEGNITEQADAAQQTQYFRNAVTEPRSTYQYDALYRLIKATGREHNTRAMPGESDFMNTISLPDNGSNVMRTYTQTYKYDQLGNLLQMKSQNVWTRDYVYNFDRNNYLLGHDLESSLNNYEYDNHGNMTKMPHLQSLSYDYANQLHYVELDAAGNKAYYVYDASGNRVRKVVIKGNITETRYYVGSYELFEKTVNGVVETKRETIHIADDKQKIALIDNLLDTDDLLLVTTIRYQLTNHLDSASLELDHEANIISYEEYHPFGTTSYRSGRSEAEVSLKRYKYVFKELDNETGLYYYGMRYYAPWIARFVNVDPLQFKYPELTPFQYASNAPISNIDLDGAEKLEYMKNAKWAGVKMGETIGHGEIEAIVDEFMLIYELNDGYQAVFHYPFYKYEGIENTRSKNEIPEIFKSFTFGHEISYEEGLLISLEYLYADESDTVNIEFTDLSNLYTNCYGSSFGALGYTDTISVQTILDSNYIKLKGYESAKVGSIGVLNDPISFAHILEIIDVDDKGRYIYKSNWNMGEEVIGTWEIIENQMESWGAIKEVKQYEYENYKETDFKWYHPKN